MDYRRMENDFIKKITKKWGGEKISFNTENLLRLAYSRGLLDMEGISFTAGVKYAQEDMRIAMGIKGLNNE